MKIVKPSSHGRFFVRVSGTLTAIAHPPQMSSLITLSLAGLSVTFKGKTFIGDAYPRAKATSEPPTRSTYGTFVGYGKAYSDPFIWAFTALVSEAERDILDSIHTEFSLLRRTFQPCDLLIVDTTSRITERSPRSRAISSGTSEVAIAPGKIAYFAQYYAWFAKPPEYTAKGRYIAATLALEEKSEKVLP